MALAPIQIARFIAVRKRPYFSPVLYAVRYVESPGLGTVGVDNFGRLYYDPAKLVEWGPEQSAAALLHEVGHILRRHGKRAPTDCEHKIWNIAGDCEINDDYENSPDVKLPPDGCYPWSFKLPNDKVVEFYYAELLKQAEKQPAQQQGGAKGKGKKGGGAGGKSAGGAGGQPGDGDDAGLGNGGFDGKGCGSGAGGEKHEHELPGTTDAQAPNGETSPAMSEVEIDVACRQTAEKIREHVAARGTVPGSWSEWAEATLRPAQIDWRKHLQRLLRGSLGVIAGMVDYSYRRISRRQSAAPGVVLPGFVRPIARVAVIADTSGSMPDEWINDSFNEVRGLAVAAGAQVRLLQVDARVAADDTLQPGSRKRIKVSGRGGTDLTTGFDRLFEKRVGRPDMVVVMTDGYTPWPPHCPAGCRVIGVFFTKPGLDAAPSWVSKVLYEPQKKEGDL